MIYLPGRKGTLAAEMVAASRRLGRMPYLLDGRMESLFAEVADGRPIAVLLNLGSGIFPRWHYAVVIGYDGNRDELILRSGKTREKRMAAARFLRAWHYSDSWAMVVVKPGDAPVTARETAFLFQAAALENAKMISAAEAAYRRAADLWPDNPAVYLGLGNCLTLQERFLGAEKSFRDLLALAPDNIIGLNNLAHTLSLRGCHREASLTIEKALRLATQTHLEDTVSTTRDEIRKRRTEGHDSAGGCRQQ